MREPLNLQKWIEENKDLLKPPVGNKRIWKDASTTVMVVGGPNQRSDFHVNLTEELFYQIKGEITLKVIEEGSIKDIKIKEGDLFLLPAGVPHSPQRAIETIGLVVEIDRNGQEDQLQWYCPNCVHLLYEESFLLKDIENQFQAIFDRFENKDIQQCPKCAQSI